MSKLMVLWSYRFKALALVLIVLSLYLFNAYNNWTHSWSLKFQSPFQNFIIIEPVPQSQFQVNLNRSEILTISERLFPKAKAAELKPEDMNTEQYIRYVFGKDANIALAVARAESGMRCDAQGINKGTNSLDAGLFQINSVHLRKGWKVVDLMDCHKNTDYAFEIQQGSGWQAWSTYKSGAYKKHLTK